MADRFHGPHLFELREKDSCGDKPDQSGDEEDDLQDKRRLPNPETEGKAPGEMLGRIPARHRTQQHAESVDQPLISDASGPLWRRHCVENEIRGGQAEPRPDESAVGLNDHEVEDMWRDQPQHGNQRNSPAADVEDLFVAEAITQLPPVSEGEELGDRGNAADDGEFHVGEVEIPQHVESEIGGGEGNTEVDRSEIEDKFGEIRVRRAPQELPEGESLLRRDPERRVLIFRKPSHGIHSGQKSRRKYDQETQFRLAYPGKEVEDASGKEKSDKSAHSRQPVPVAEKATSDVGRYKIPYQAVPDRHRGSAGALVDDHEHQKAKDRQAAASEEKGEKRHGEEGCALRCRPCEDDFAPASKAIHFHGPEPLHQRSEELGQGGQKPDLEGAGPEEYAEWSEVGLPATHHHRVGYPVFYSGPKGWSLFRLIFIWFRCVHFRRPALFLNLYAGPRPRRSLRQRVPSQILQRATR